MTSAILSSTFQALPLSILSQNTPNDRGLSSKKSFKKVSFATPPSRPIATLRQLTPLLSKLDPSHELNFPKYREERGLFACAYLLSGIFKRQFPNQPLPPSRSLVYYFSASPLSYAPNVIEAAIKKLDLRLIIDRTVTDPASSEMISEILASSALDLIPHPETTLGACSGYIEQLTQAQQTEIKTHPAALIGHGIAAYLCAKKAGWNPQKSLEASLDLFGDWWFMLSKTKLTKKDPEFAIWKTLTLEILQS